MICISLQETKPRYDSGRSSGPTKQAQSFTGPRAALLSIPQAPLSSLPGRPRPLGEALTVVLLYVHLGLTKNSVRWCRNLLFDLNVITRFYYQGQKKWQETSQRRNLHSAGQHHVELPKGVRCLEKA